MQKLFSLQNEGNKSTLSVLKDYLLADDNEKFKKEFDEILPEFKDEVIMDFKDVEYISSLLLASMIYILKKLNESNKKLILTNLKPNVEEMLQVTNLDKVFEIKK